MIVTFPGYLHLFSIGNIHSNDLILLIKGGGRVWRRRHVYYVPGHPTDIGLQLGKAYYPCSR